MTTVSNPNSPHSKSKSQYTETMASSIRPQPGNAGEFRGSGTRRERLGKVWGRSIYDKDARNYCARHAVFKSLIYGWA